MPPKGGMVNTTFRLPVGEDVKGPPNSLGFIHGCCFVSHRSVVVKRYSLTQNESKRLGCPTDFGLWGKVSNQKSTTDDFLLVRDLYPPAIGQNSIYAQTKKLN